MSASMDAKVQQAFADHFGYSPSHSSRAPGRINIIGEHTDYNDGFVLPAAIEQAVYGAGHQRADDIINLHSLDYHDSVTVPLSDLRAEGLPSWTRLLLGVLWIMQRAEHPLGGMDITIGGDVPLGAGFSSSAAAELSLIELTCGLFNLSLTQRDKALLGPQTEHTILGVRTGVMDQMISALGQADHALLLDCRSLETRTVPIPQGVTLLALDTGKRRELTNSGYNQRRAECEEAARLLGVQSLRDATPQMVAQRHAELPPIIERRATHVVTENVRTLAAAEALEAGDLAAVGKLLNEGHASLRDLYEISIPELDTMAALVQQEEGCYGARMMGGGFGGAVIALVDDQAVERITQTVGQLYNNMTHLQALIYPTKAAAGSTVQRVK